MDEDLNPKVKVKGSNLRSCNLRYMGHLVYVKYPSLSF
jgi:hypothetical protein